MSIRDTEAGLEVRINEGAYGNLAIVGLLEKIKMTLLTEVSENPDTVTVPTNKSGNHA
ncbi:MAG: hypothetical protein NTY55_02970 [Flavobacteriia bacterium]|nr:hypothetical protein [Flavobacteriia bacterium]